MFEVIYLFVLAWAALPLVRTLMLERGGNHIAFVHRLYRDAAYILLSVLGIVVFEAALRISLENYWFEELDQSHRYWLSLEYRVAIFLVVSLLVGLFVGANLRALGRPYAIVPRSAPWIIGFVLAALVGFLATPLWIPLRRPNSFRCRVAAPTIWSKLRISHCISTPRRKAARSSLSS
jgi:hypothetical protein